jgi:eukaryotic-like serine/threonine-protein kinase
MARLSGATPSPAAVRTGVPPALDAIVRRAMARDPAQRYRSAAEMADALDSFLADRAPAAGQAPGIGTAAAAGAIAGAGMAAGEAARSGAGVTATQAAEPLSPATVASGIARPNPGGLPYSPDSYARSNEPPPSRYSEPPPRRPRDRGYDDRYDDDDRGGTSPWVWISALLALAILAVVGFLVFRLLAGPGTPAVEKVTLPSFINKTLDQARVDASRLGITLEVTGNDPNSTKPPNTILTQVPGPGETVDKGSAVSVTVSAAKEQVQVPTLVGEKEADAVQLLLEAGLVRGNVTQAFDNTIPNGSVVSQNPPPGRTVAKGTPVDYVVSKGAEPTPPPAPTATPAPTPVVTPAPINVGDYRCITLGEASNLIEADGFRVGNVVVDTPGSAPEEGFIVVAQAPAPGSKRRPNSRIDLTVHDPATPLATCPPPAG